MKQIFIPFLVFLMATSCKVQKEEEAAVKEPAVLWERQDETAQLKEQAQHENERMRFKLINSKTLDKNEIWRPFEKELSAFSAEKYESLKPVIFERSIPELQRAIQSGKLSYTDLTLFYIYRIREFESNNEMSLNAVIALNPDVVAEARKLDEKGVPEGRENTIYGMPILLKDNVNTDNMSTTAGALILAENKPSKNAFIVDRLKENNALILGKANLSEWAYYFCDGCPLGYSAVGGQTLNPYGRKKFETGGSSSGSGVAVAANYAVAAVGTETAGSILSPASKNSVVGLKPTVGLLSRTGIIPISGTLDTPGPMTKYVIDNAILLNALTGKDSEDPASVSGGKNYVKALTPDGLRGKRIGVMKSLLTDSLYNNAVEAMKESGATVVEFEEEQVSLDNFLTLLNADMKKDLPAYLSKYAGKEVTYNNVEAIVKYNLEDSLIRAPYGQQLFDAIVADTTSAEELERISAQLQESGRKFFDEPMERYDLDAVASINNYHAAYAAVAKYPALAVPAGFESSGEPKSITFIAKPFEEDKLLNIGNSFEQLNYLRKPPGNYR
ncbi:amidase family protein [Salinimicrobium sp. TH3]|uniref:amidase family protein n=1 Tax=Salinimicrobium sp. TH3 TaxID=2997342 RepID=UPI002276E25B|nr:amidase family protein [Salinimicrobium sp. TH3]MCY2687432.1 amidase family protein [Salinimicrobium sp. TH3]